MRPLADGDKCDARESQRRSGDCAGEQCNSQRNGLEHVDAVAAEESDSNRAKKKREDASEEEVHLHHVLAVDDTPQHPQREEENVNASHHLVEGEVLYRQPEHTARIDSAGHNDVACIRVTRGKDQIVAS